MRIGDTPLSVSFLSLFTLFDSKNEWIKGVWKGRG